MKQLELSISIAFAVLLFGGNFLLSTSQTTHKDRTTTYVPKINLSDGASWEDTVGNSVSTEAYVKDDRPSENSSSGNSSPSTSDRSPSQASRSQTSLKQMRQRSASKAFGRKGGSFASSIIVKQSNASWEDSPSKTRGNDNPLADLWSLGIFSEDAQSNSSRERSENTSTLLASNHRGTADIQPSVVSVPVTLQTELDLVLTQVARTSVASDSVWTDRILWIATFVTAACGLVGVGQYLMGKYLSDKYHVRG
ncbi:MAG: hypothetical protein SWY16_01700 [Cyanobacteriota bacterium]|nr:hypothetical protein [Cyanobacteriota bacterium]